MMSTDLLNQMKEHGAGYKQVKRRRRRSRTEMLADVLYALEQEPLQITRIMYASNLPWVQARDVLAWLVAHGFAEEHGPEYMITDDGRKVLETARVLNALLQREPHHHNPRYFPVWQGGPK